MDKENALRHVIREEIKRLDEVEGVNLDNYDRETPLLRPVLEYAASQGVNLNRTGSVLSHETKYIHMSNVSGKAKISGAPSIDFLSVPTEPGVTFGTGGAHDTFTDSLSLAKDCVDIIIENDGVPGYADLPDREDLKNMAPGFEMQYTHDPILDKKVEVGGRRDAAKVAYAVYLRTGVEPEYIGAENPQSGEGEERYRISSDMVIEGSSRPQTYVLNTPDGVLVDKGRFIMSVIMRNL